MPKQATSIGLTETTTVDSAARQELATRVLVGLLSGPQRENYDYNTEAVYDAVEVADFLLETLASKAPGTVRLENFEEEVVDADEDDSEEETASNTSHSTTSGDDKKSRGFFGFGGK